MKTIYLVIETVDENIIRRLSFTSFNQAKDYIDKRYEGYEKFENAARPYKEYSAPIISYKYIIVPIPLYDERDDNQSDDPDTDEHSSDSKFLLDYDEPMPLNEQDAWRDYCMSHPCDL